VQTPSTQEADSEEDGKAEPADRPIAPGTTATALELHARNHRRALTLIGDHNLTIVARPGEIIGGRRGTLRAIGHRWTGGPWRDIPAHIASMT